MSNSSARSNQLQYEQLGNAVCDHNGAGVSLAGLQPRDKPAGMAKPTCNAEERAFIAFELSNLTRRSPRTRTENSQFVLGPGGQPGIKSDAQLG
jgi:hypothetical protein